MSAGEPEQQAETVEEPGEMSERVAKGIVVLIAAGAVWGLVAAFPWIAYIVVGVLGTLVWQRLSGWIAGRRKDDEAVGEQDGEPEPISKLDVVEALHEVATPHALLADLAAALDVTKDAARAVLEHFRIRVRRAVRNGESTGVGVHKDDFPPLPPLASEDPVDGVDLQQPTNQQGGVRVERVEGGLRIYDLADAHRTYKVT